jgi:hypothetical protein
MRSDAEGGVAENPVKCLFDHSFNMTINGRTGPTSLGKSQPYFARDGSRLVAKKSCFLTQLA